MEKGSFGLFKTALPGGETIARIFLFFAEGVSYSPTGAHFHFNFFVLRFSFLLLLSLLPTAVPILNYFSSLSSISLV
jgi:hypothetical protein